MSVILLLLYLACITPVKLGAALSLGSGPAEAAVGVMIWGWKRVIRIRVRRWNGAPRLCAETRGRSVILRPKRGAGFGKTAAKTLLRGLTGKPGRRALQWTALDGLIQIGGQDAASAALITGGLRGLLSLLPAGGVRCVPAYGGETVLRLRCIAQARLGTILAAGLLTAGRKEEGVWIIPSGN